MQRLGEPKVCTVKTQVYQQKSKEYNYLKYWRIVRHYICKRYEISLSELELLLYFYDETVFTRTQFNEYCSILSWDNNRFKDLVERDLVRKWRDGKGQVSHLYELTVRSKRICNLTYKKLAGESINEDPTKNKIMKGESYSDKVYRNMIRKMNERKPPQ